MIGHAYLIKLYPSHTFDFSSIYAPRYAPAIKLSHCEKMWEDLKLIGTTIEKPGCPTTYFIID